MITGTYIGPDPKLKGEDALVRLYKKRFILCQFNNWIKKDEKLFFDTPGNSLAHGWHKFPKKFFKITHH